MSSNVHLTINHFLENFEKFAKLMTSVAPDRVERPGTYRGTHFFQSGMQYYAWANAQDGSSCGTAKWFFENIKDGDSFRKVGVCRDSGMDEVEINLVA